ncbi:MAG TPA: trigger factor, partial [Candidatus Gracilibacteria bacterium]|nr:trigger factor [Candidatus Gracilibacteria bacterium]
MEIQKKILENSQVELIVTLSEEELTKYTKKALEKLNQELKVPGFRTGHIPEDILVSHAGLERINEKMVNLAIEGTWVKAVEQEKLWVISYPQVKDIKMEPTLSYVAVVEVKPELKMADYSKIQENIPEVKLEDSDIQKVLEQIQNDLTRFNEIDAPAQKEDVVKVDVHATDLEGKDVPELHRHDFSFKVGEEIYMPEVSAAVIGMKTGESKTLKVKFSKEFFREAWREKEANIAFDLVKVSRPEVPAIDDELAKKAFNDPSQTLDGLKQEIQTHLLAEKRKEAIQKIEEIVLEKLRNLTEVDLPKSMLDNQIADFKHQRIEFLK